jgi:hypothetical protein
LTRKHEETLKSIPLLEPPLLFAALHLGEGIFLALVAWTNLCNFGELLAITFILGNLFQPSLLKRKTYSSVYYIHDYLLQLTHYNYLTY